MGGAVSLIDGHIDSDFHKNPHISIFNYGDGTYSWAIIYENPVTKVTTIFSTGVAKDDFSAYKAAKFEAVKFGW